MMQEKRIPLSRSVRWRRIRSQTVPLLSFLVAVALSAWLWQHHGTVAHGIGEVDSPRVDVTSPTAGLVVSLPNQLHGQWLVYDHVRAGEIIARIEDPLLESNKNQLRQQIDQLLDAVEKRRDAPPDGDRGAGEATDAIVRSAWKNEEARLRRLNEQLAVAPQATLDDDPDLVAAPPELPQTVSAAARDALAHVRGTRVALELRRVEIQLSSKSLDVPAPISGTLVAVHCWPGQTVPPGGLIATIAADFGRNIIGYIPEQSSLIARPGMQVTLRARATGSTLLASEVEEVGKWIERVPIHQRSSSTPEWGTPVRIKMPGQAMLQPGALVDVLFDGS